MSALNDLVLPIPVLKTLGDEIAGRIAGQKAEAKAAFTELGASRVDATLPDGTKVASVTLSGEGSKSASVTNPGALLAWVETEYPGEVEVKVRDSFLKKILDAAAAEGRPVDAATGEVIPGITVKDTTPFLSVRFKDGGRAAIVAAWRAGQLAGIDVVGPLAIPGDAA